MGGAIASIIGTVFLGIASKGDVMALSTSLIFGISMTLLFSASATYHLVTGPEKLIWVCKIIDHCMIYVLIAGTYTPIVTLSLTGAVRLTYIIGIWVCALVGIIIKMFLTGRFRTTSTILYMAMGSTIMFAIKPLMASIGFNGLMFLVVGGIFYIAGGVFYAAKKPLISNEFGFHEIFHIFVLLGAFSHFALIYWFIL